MRKYRKYYMDYIVLTVAQVLWMSIAWFIVFMVYWWFKGVYLFGYHLFLTAWIVFWHYYFAPYPLKKLVPILKDIRRTNFETYRGVVKSFTKRRRFSIVSWDRFFLSLSIEGSEAVLEFTGFANDLLEDYLPGDHVEVLAMPTAKVILSIARISDSEPAD